MPDVDQSEFSVLIELPKDISIEDASAEVAVPNSGCSTNLR